MLKTVLYDEGEKLVGEFEVYFDDNNKKNSFSYSNSMIELLNKGLMIKGLSKPGKRCNPLAVLHTITSESSSGVCFKLIDLRRQRDTPLFALHSTCLRENKTIVVPFGDEEIHLVAMRSRRNEISACFWGFNVAPGLYEACLGMLNLRCLGIVFDLDETLIVANTLRSFEDRIESLQRKLSVETDSQRIAGMVAEVKRYQDDKSILKQYAETDQVVDNGKVHKIQPEVVLALSDNHQTIVRPLIRLQEKNIVLTRINPQNRDTSVLVRLRPAWEDLRSYLTAKGRKRFEVYVCTMAERDYALEMWRLLDPDSNLINTTEVLDRVVCVKSGSKKSLFNVFHNGFCDPKMALVIDDRLKVWDEKDQSRVHVVPAFSPYYAPQAEANNVIPVLCVARNIACNVRGGFFKEFDDIFLQRINEVSFEDDLKDVPCPPDVSNFMVSEDDSACSNGNKEPLCINGMADTEVERRLKEVALSLTSAPSLLSAPSLASVKLDSGLGSSLPFTMAASPLTTPQATTQISSTPFYTNLVSQVGPLVRPLSSIGPTDMPACEEGEVPESELDPDTRRRLLILQHGRDNLSNESLFPVKALPQAPVAGPVPGSLPLMGPGLGVGAGPVPSPGPGPGPVPRMQSRDSWFPVEHAMGPRPIGPPVPYNFPMGPDSVYFENQRPPFQQRVDSSTQSERFFSEKQRLPREAPRRDVRLRSNQSLPGHQSFEGDDRSFSQSSNNKNCEVVPEQGISFPESPYGALRDIAMRVGAKVEFNTGLVPATELRFFMEAYFAGERIGEGTGVRRREAQHRAAEAALMNLADRYLAHMKSDSPESGTNKGYSPINMRHPSASPGDGTLTKEVTVLSFEPMNPDDSNVEDTNNSTSSVSALKELCMREGLVFDFRAPSPSSTSSIQGGEMYAEVKIDGKVLGKGTGLTWDEAKVQAAENTLSSLKSMRYQLKRVGSPRSLKGMTSKRSKPEYPLVLQQMSSPTF